MIRVENLTKNYGLTKAIDQISFDVQPGEIVGLLGPNGAGKSTTMRILTGAMGASSGTAIVGGIDVAKDPIGVKRLTGFLPEVPPLYTDMTVTDFLRFAAQIKGVQSPKAAAQRTLGLVGLDDVAGRLIAHLSKGYRQRVGIAQALVHQPKLLILDEPASGLDPAQRVEIRELVRSLAQGDTTVMLSTHVLPEIDTLCDRVVILHKGKMVATERLDDLRRKDNQLLLTVERPDALDAALKAMPNLTEVSRTDRQFRIVCSPEARAAVTTEAGRHGLLRLTGGGLEDIYLRALSNDSEVVA